jgi:hypothetical protein
MKWLLALIFGMIVGAIIFFAVRKLRRNKSASFEQKPDPKKPQELNPKRSDISTSVHATEGMLVIHIHGEINDTGTALEDTLTKLEDSLLIIRNNLDSKDIFYIALDILGTWTPEQGEFNAWNNGNEDFWVNVAKRPNLHDRAHAWLDAIEDIQKAKHTKRVQTVWEDELTQLPEVAVTALARNHLGFVTRYADFLRIWDMDHEVHQSKAITELVERYGICPATEDLIRARVTGNGIGQHGDEQFDELLTELRQHFDNFAMSEFFKSVVILRYQEEYDFRETQWKRTGQKRKTEIEFVEVLPFELREDALRIVAELEAASDPPPWAP